MNAIESIIPFVLIGAAFGYAAAYAALLWSWEWFGDIWHQNSVSSLWGIPIVILFALNLFCVWITPRIIRGLKVYWWHYLSAILGFAAGIAIFVMSVR